MNINHIALNLINKLFNDKGHETSKGNYSYFCPKCNHHKRKLEINLNQDSPNFGTFNCWVCNFKSKSPKALLKVFKTSDDNIAEIKKIFKIKGNKEEISLKKLTELPKEFKPFWIQNKSSKIYNQGKNYLASRGLNQADIIKYNIGYCEEGEYKNKLIFPSYDENNKVNFFVTKDITTQNYKNPEFSRDIIFYENQINWNQPIIICEGVFDAITIKRNAIPLLGKVLSKQLLKKIFEKNVQKIYLSLDSDAFKSQLKICDMLIKEGIDIYWINLDAKDPNDLGFEQFYNIVYETKKMTLKDLIEKKLF